MWGTVRGVVRRVSLDRGRFVVDTGSEKLLLRATPTQIAGLRRGERFIGCYANFGRGLWLMQDFERDSAARFSRSTAATASVKKVDVVSGLLTVQTGGRLRVLRGHPVDIATLAPGEYVTVHFDHIGRFDWVNAVERQPAPRERHGATDSRQ